MGYTGEVPYWRLGNEWGLSQTDIGTFDMWCDMNSGLCPVIQVDVNLFNTINS